jgi:hypothetical protein
MRFWTLAGSTTTIPGPWAARRVKWAVIEGQQMADPMGMTACDQAGVVYLLADDAHGIHEGLPGWIDGRSLDEKREGRLEDVSPGGRLQRGQSQSVPGDGSGRGVAEFDEVLRGYVQRFAATVQFDHRADGDGILHIRRVREPTQDTGIDPIGHYS